MKQVGQKIIVTERLGAAAYFIGGVCLFIGAIIFFIEMYLIGSISLAIGLFLVGYCCRVVIDKEANSAVRKWGIFFPVITRKRMPLDGITAVIVTRHHTVSHGGASGYSHVGRHYTDWHVLLEHPDGNFLVAEKGDHEKAYPVARKIAELLGVKTYRDNQEG